MKKKIVILGSTGSIGKNTINIIRNKKKFFQIKLLSTNRNIKEIIKQSNEFNVKNIIIKDPDKFIEAKKKYKDTKKNFYNDFDSINKIIKNNEIYYSMVSIVGIDGLKPALDLIKKSKNIAIANKESLVCGWSLIKKKLDFYKTKFIPVDSEHFSINLLLKDHNKSFIKNIYITASGGPFLKNKNFKKNFLLKDAIKHPNWKMGKKISIDSATLMNKVFEVIEAKNIFNLNYNQIKILIHSKSYIHGIVELNNGLVKLLAHDPNMIIPISNSIYENKVYLKNKKINFSLLNDLDFKKVNFKQFPLIKILKNLPSFNSLYETALITINDYFVNLFINKKITFQQMVKLILMNLNDKKIIKYNKIPVKNIYQIKKLKKYLSIKLDNMVYKT